MIRSSRATLPSSPRERSEPTDAAGPIRTRRGRGARRGAICYAGRRVQGRLHHRGASLPTRGGGRRHPARLRSAHCPEFQAEAEGAPDVTLCATRIDDLLNPGFTGETETVRGSSGTGAPLVIRRSDFEGTWDATERVARCTYTEGLPALNSFLRVVSSFAPSSLQGDPPPRVECRVRWAGRSRSRDSPRAPERRRSRVSVLLVPSSRMR